MDELEARIAELQAEEELARSARARRPAGDGPPRDLAGPVVGEALSFLLELRLDHGPMPEDEAYARLGAWAAERRRFRATRPLERRTKRVKLDGWRGGVSFWARRGSSACLAAVERSTDTRGGRGRSTRSGAHECWAAAVRGSPHSVGPAAAHAMVVVVVAIGVRLDRRQRVGYRFAGPVPPESWPPDAGAEVEVAGGDRERVHRGSGTRSSPCARPRSHSGSVVPYRCGRAGATDAFVPGPISAIAAGIVNSARRRCSSAGRARNTV